MSRLTFAPPLAGAACTLLAVAAGLAAQPPSPAPPPAPAPAARDTAAARRAEDPDLSGGGAAIARFNAPGTRRVRGAFAVAERDTVAGDVAVVGGPVTVAGRIAGRLTVVNGDLTLRPTAAVDGEVLVVGGVVDGQRVARLGAELRLIRRPIAYVVDADSLVAADSAATPSRFDLLWRLRSRSPDRRTTAGVTLASGGTYNRTEGLPVLFGPSVEWAVGGRGRLAVELLGIYRTAEAFRWNPEHVGHDARLALRTGPRRAARLGVRLYDEVAPVEAWHLGADETGLAAFALRRDFRDYYNRHGGGVTFGLDASPDVGFTLGWARERWASRRAYRTLSLLRNGAPWRPNPAADEGLVGLFTASARLDTRNDETRPWAGWYLGVDYERGAGDFEQFAPNGSLALVAPGRRTYGRAFADVRRYNRLTPDAQLNLRVAGGGWVHGDPLPAQRRLSVSGPGALAGYDFRRAAGPDGEDVAQCAPRGVRLSGDPALCDRVLLAQAEYRHDVRLSLFGGGGESGPRFRRGRRTEFTWVLFADAGRGWAVGGAGAPATGGARGFGAFLSQVGAGVDFGHPHGRRDVGPFGVYVAKSVSTPDQAANVFVRLRRRF